MKYVDEFRQAGLCEGVADEIVRAARRRWTVMEVCGGQTHGLLKYGIDERLAPAVELIHGPGCPICVTPASAIDLACALARRPGFALVSFGDMLRVPGSRESLLEARAQGGDVRLVYSPLDAVRLAQAEPSRQFVFFAVGFETTAPATALAVARAQAQGLENFSLLSAHVRVLPAMELIAAHPRRRVQAFLAAGHVCTVTGYADYHGLIARHALPVVVAGFEPLDLLVAIREAVRMLESGRPELGNAYARAVGEAGNPAAQALVDAWFEPVDAPWRGLGIIPRGGLTLRQHAARFDARARWCEEPAAEQGEGECQAGAVLLGSLKPPECPHFGLGCRPEHPLGAPMVSAEGACAAYFRFHHTGLALQGAIRE